MSVRCFFYFALQVKFCAVLYGDYYIGGYYTVEVNICWLFIANINMNVIFPIMHDIFYLSLSIK